MTTAKIQNSHPYQVGGKYLIRTVSFYYTGQLEAVHEHELALSNGAWVADTGRFGEALETGKLAELEVLGDCIIGRGAIVDCIPWRHELPNKTK